MAMPVSLLFGKFVIKEAIVFEYTLQAISLQVDYQEESGEEVEILCKNLP